MEELADSTRFAESLPTSGLFNAKLILPLKHLKQRTVYLGEEGDGRSFEAWIVQHAELACRLVMPTSRLDSFWRVEASRGSIRLAYTMTGPASQLV